jgi:predicted acylesterase/phospholipase RssA
MTGAKRGLMAVFLCLSLTTGNVLAAQNQQKQRFSIAISGGASKGSYEAGLNWAVLKITREVEKLKSLRGGEPRPMELASVAGASAGGVNTILSGLAWCSRPESDGGIANSVDDNVFRSIWLRLDINTLLPAKADSESYLPDDAVLSRRDYFDAADDLRKQWQQPAYRVGCRVPMGVTVTRVHPQELMVGELEVQNQRFFIPFELRVGDDGSVAFFFDPADYPKLSDPAMILMPRARDAPPFSISNERIIEAAAATSAFPAAFGRRRFEYCRLAVRRTSAEPETQPPEAEQTDTDLVCPPGYELDEAEFADGGLFDNLPIGLARTLAEFNVRAFENPYPVTYLYIDPNRIRYETPEPPDNTACASANPPEACRIMDFSLFSESTLLLGAMGTARKYELYRETTSEHWRFNLSQLSYELGDILTERSPNFDCGSELPYFEPPVDCAQAVRRAGRLLEIAYDRFRAVISPPYSPERLVETGVADNCVRSSDDTESGQHTACRIDVTRYRDRLGEALIAIMDRAQIDGRKLYVSISRSRQSTDDDRALRVSSRGAPITGTLLSDFGSFLDYKFREYDYYVGVYDAVAVITRQLCGLQYPSERQPEEFGRCVDLLGEQLYNALDVSSDARGRYVFNRLAEREFAKDGLFGFSYSTPPPADRDMQIIHNALAKALGAGEKIEEDEENIFFTEDTFFEFLNAESFVPTRTPDGREPLLTQIIADPDQWPTELTRRVTARLVYLERQAADINAAREPDPDQRESSYTTLMGTTAYLMQSATYKHPTFTFSPSTAPGDWIWRYVIPYELGWDLVEGDILMTWQPTMALSENNLLDLRASLGYAGGLFRSSSNRNRENYFGLGVGYIRRTGSTPISSFGITPTWYHAWSQPEIGSQDTAGGDINVSFMKDRLRVGLGTRDIRNFGDQWFLTFGITDLPGLAYWLTR